MKLSGRVSLFTEVLGEIQIQRRTPCLSAVKEAARIGYLTLLEVSRPENLLAMRATDSVVLFVDKLIGVDYVVAVNLQS